MQPRTTAGAIATQPWCYWPSGHGLRASELVDLRWEQVDLENAILHVRRVKQGTPATHPLTGRELRALRRLQREQGSRSPFIFVSERGAPFAKRGFQAMVERAARAAGFDMKIHPHMLRHSCGYKLANDGVDTRTIQSYLGHKSIQHTVRYTELAPTRFKSLFRDGLWGVRAARGWRPADVFHECKRIEGRTSDADHQSSAAGA